MALAAGALAIIATSQFASAATTVASDSTALDVNLTVLGIISVNLPTAVASGTAAPAYNASNTLLSLNTTAGLSLGSLVTTASDGPSTNAISDTASSTYPAVLSGTATSTVNGLSSNLALVSALVNLLSISATTLTSTSTAAKPAGTLNLTGTSEIENLTVTDGVVGLGGSTVTINAGALASTPVNDLILSAAGLNVYTNYQTPVINGGVTDGINTAALAINLNNFAFGTGLLSGSILFADSQASIVTPSAAVPEPASWAMMLVGFGLTGAAVRRKQLYALARA
jgi:hypothetical protein